MRLFFRVLAPSKMDWFWMLVFSKFFHLGFLDPPKIGNQIAGSGLEVFPVPSLN